MTAAGGQAPRADFAVPPRASASAEARAAAGAAAVAALNSPTVCPSWVLPKVEVEGWFMRARPGERLIYARGPDLIRGETSRYVGQLCETGLADPSQPRAEGCYGFDFTIQKRTPPKPGRPAAVAGAAGPPDEAIKAIAAAIERAARAGRRCPTDPELARIAGLATAAQAAWRVAKLREAGTIATETVTGPDGPWRIATWRASGHRTAGPPAPAREARR